MKTAGILERLNSKDVRLKIIVVLGILGMLLILLSQFNQQPKAPAGPPEDAVSCFTTEYIAGLEYRLTELLSQIDGVGRTQVMVTLASGVEYVYARDETRNIDLVRDGNDEARIIHQTENVEERFILVDTERGRREPLVLKRLQPRIQGVIVVCEGADDIRVEKKVISVVTTALGIPSTRVSVVRIS